MFFYREGMIDCLGCDAEWFNVGDDLADRFDSPTVDKIEFDIDPDMIENDELYDLGDEIDDE